MRWLTLQAAGPAEMPSTALPTVSCRWRCQLCRSPVATPASGTPWPMPTAMRASPWLRLPRPRRRQRRQQRGWQRSSSSSSSKQLQHDRQEHAPPSVPSVCLPGGPARRILRAVLTTHCNRGHPGQPHCCTGSFRRLNESVQAVAFVHQLASTTHGL